MKQDKRPAGAAVKKRRFFNRISRKLMLFVVLMSMVLLALVWLLSVKLLEPMYNRRVLADLNHAADVYSAIIEKYGKFESFDKSGGVHIPSDMMEEIMDNRGLLAGKCFEVAGTDCKVLLHLHQLQSDQCLLHPNPLSQLMEYSEPQWNSTAAVNLRATTFVLGDLNFTLPDSRILPGLESTSGTRQMVVCRNINNQYSLILSTDLERVGQAADVISAQMPIIAAVLLIVSIAGAYVFSRWFTKPISAISRAAREMARGNYKVRVTPQADDELGALAGDFNTMAREVGRTSELQRDLIANVSHDLRTPLTLIKGYAETVRDLTGDNKEKRDEQLSVIVDETDRLSGLVNSVMELSKYSSGTEKLNPVQFDLAQLCDEVAYRYQNICEQSGYTLTVDAADPCTVTADPDMMSRVVHNLLANAIHHIGPDGCVALRVKPQPDAAVRVEIEDHGAGIAREDLPYIFDKYYRSRADAGKVGTGLGLSITKAILINHGFPFGVDSEPGNVPLRERSHPCRRSTRRWKPPNSMPPSRCSKPRSPRSRPRAWRSIWPAASRRPPRWTSLDPCSISSMPMPICTTATSIVPTTAALRAFPRHASWQGGSWAAPPSRRSCWVHRAC